jgi:hypothetical protein
MKRHKFAVLSFILFLQPFLCAQSNNDGAIKDEDISALLPSFYELWKDSAFGNDPNRTERAAWIIRNNDGSFKFHRWRSSGAWASETWVGALPENIVGQAHTHPTKRDPRPSPKDRSLSKKRNVSLYTISLHGVWRVDPEGKLTKVAGNNWNKPLREASLKLKENNNENK